MDERCKEIIWKQFGAAIDALENAIIACPDETWGSDDIKPDFWYMVYHTLFWLDYYLSDNPSEYVPPSPFTLAEADPAGVLPDRVYTKAEMLSFLAIGRANSRRLIANMTEERGARLVQLSRVAIPTSELVLYTMRHIQHHTGQLNFLLRQRHDIGSRWTFGSKVGLKD